MDNTIPTVDGKRLTTYNLEVANPHTFSVGESGVLVHNGGHGHGCMSPSKAGVGKACDIKNKAGRDFDERNKGTNKSAQSGQGHKRQSAQAKALDDWIKEHGSDCVDEYLNPIKTWRNRMRRRANGSKHK